MWHDLRVGEQVATGGEQAGTNPWKIATLSIIVGLVVAVIAAASFALGRRDASQTPPGTASPVTLSPRVTTTPPSQSDPSDGRLSPDEYRLVQEVLAASNLDPPATGLSLEALENLGAETCSLALTATSEEALFQTAVDRYRSNGASDYFAIAGAKMASAAASMMCLDDLIDLPRA